MIWKNIRIWTIHSKTECMQRRVKLSRFSLAFEIDFFCLTKSPAPHLPEGLGQFYHFVAPSEGSSSWARLWRCLPGSWRCPARTTSGSSGWPRPRSGPEQACSLWPTQLCKTLDFSQPMTCEFHSTQKRNSLPLCDSDLFLPQNRWNFVSEQTWPMDRRGE